MALSIYTAGTVVKPTCGEDIVSSDSVMQVEVLLCYFKQPSAEVSVHAMILQSKNSTSYSLKPMHLTREQKALLLECRGSRQDYMSSLGAFQLEVKAV